MKLWKMAKKKKNHNDYLTILKIAEYWNKAEIKYEDRKMKRTKIRN